jgi:DNA replication and repair protein RecF
VIVTSLELRNFRNYEHATITFSRGITVFIGGNGHGKTNIAESLGYLATTKSFRGVSNDALVRTGCDNAIVRATIIHDDGREFLVEAEIPRAGRGRIQVNRKNLARTRDLLGVARVTVFSPDDLSIIKGSPSLRREWLDDAVVALNPAHASIVADFERALRQRNALLKDMGFRPSREEIATLDAWDDAFVAAAGALADVRTRVLDGVRDAVTRAYDDLAGEPSNVDVSIESTWSDAGLADNVRRARDEDMRRGTTSVGPHRDDVVISVNGLPTRVAASQGEQRTMALALRLAVHRAVGAAHGSPPVLILDDVLSELDPDRSRALLAHVPDGQVIITTASPLPSDARWDDMWTVNDGTLTRVPAEASHAPGGAT